VNLSVFTSSRWLLKTSPHRDRDSSGIPDEGLFNRQLCLERKRSERTSDPFVLMILDIARLNGSAPPPKIAEVCAALRAETRDTDLCGWYQFPSAIGTIFTALRGADRLSIESSLSGKVGRVLQAVLSPAELQKVAISFHFFPEEIDRGKPSLKSDDSLYPDVKNGNGKSRLHQVLKRALDVVGSIGGLIIFAPVFLLISLLIKLTSKGPVFFKQRRIGQFGREFWFLKFRSMYVDCDHRIHEQYVRKLIQKVDKSQKVYKIVKDPRVTPLGHFLRKSSLDELPQLINVLWGEMSLVGPRPPIPYEVAWYKVWHRRRVIEVKPGITGLWQVKGRSRTTFDEMVRLDLRYVREQSLWLDLKLLLMTPWVVLTGSGAY
jgi:lipopolysaccharide/colanic/teichoic acid biosynthesis glycosyltransferase